MYRNFKLFTEFKVYFSLLKVEFFFPPLKILLSSVRDELHIDGILIYHMEIVLYLSKHPKIIKNLKALKSKPE